MADEGYAEKYVLFLDILGFSDEVTKADSDLELRAQIKKVLGYVRDTLSENLNTGHTFTYFSDCLVVSSNRTFDGLRDMIASVRWVTFNLLNQGYLVRGGLTVGLIHHDADFVFGLPLITAHKLESQDARFPRTIVCESVLEDIKLHGEVTMSHFLMDADGKYFLNYLLDYSNYDKVNIWAGKLVLDYSANHIINHIQNKLNEYSEKPLEKVIWFQNYWNKEVASRGVFPRIEKGVYSDLPDGSPSNVVTRMIV